MQYIHILYTQLTMAASTVSAVSLQSSLRMTKDELNDHEPIGKIHFEEVGQAPSLGATEQNSESLMTPLIGQQQFQAQW